MNIATDLPLMKLKYVSLIEMGQSPPSSEYTLSEDSGLPFLQGTADFGVKHPTPRVYCSEPTKVAKHNDIFISVRAPVGQLNIADQEYGIGRGLCAVRCQSALDRDFAWWALHWVREQLTYEATGSTYEAVAVSDIANLLIPLPPLPKQRAIAAYLDRETARLDALTAAWERLLGLLAEKRQALISHAVTRGLNPAAPLRDSGVAWLGEIPAHWEVTRLKTVSESLQTGPFGTQLHAEEYVEDGTPVINPAHLVDNKIVPDPKVSVNDWMAEHLAMHKLQVGDIVLARRGDIGRCGLVTAKEAGWLCGTGSLRARPRKTIINPEYLTFLIGDSPANTWLSLMAVGTTMKNLNTEIIGELAIPLPPLAEQNQIIHFINQNIQRLDTIDQIIRGKEKMKALLYERRAALITAAVSGKIEVSR